MNGIELCELGFTIRRLRAERKFTLKILSNKTGIQTATLSRIENHKTPGSLKNHFRIAKALDLKLSDLIKEYECSSV